MNGASKRGYLLDDPLRALAPFDTTPRTYRRAMTTEEVVRLLGCCPPHHRLLLETAFLSGLRANELRNLTFDHLDLERSELRLDAAWTKNRKDGVQPLPNILMARLKDVGDSGEASRLYKRFHSRKDARGKLPSHPLLFVPAHAARTLDEALKVAGIPKYSPAGKLDFHACRLAYINFVIESGVTVKEAQTLARHSTPDLTMNTYGRARTEKLAEAVEKVAANLSRAKKVVPGLYREAVGAET